MLTLVSSNPAKYAAFAGELERLRLRLEAPPEPVPELQSASFPEAVAQKARSAASLFGRPVLVDDAGLVLEAYSAFPGPLTASVLRSLGAAGLRRLVEGVSPRATMECHLGCWLGNTVKTWAGRVDGRLDFSRPVRDPRMMLADLFVADGAAETPRLAHRARALEAFAKDALELHLDMAPDPHASENGCASRPAYECPFCTELGRDGSGIYAEMMGNKLPSRSIYEDEHFVVFPPLGEFMEGGLLVLTRQHMLSFAHLPPQLFPLLERLLGVIRTKLHDRWGVAPIIFEHGPAPERSKGVCCVDHAHLNIFPAPVRVHPHLAARMHLPIRALTEISRLRRAEFGYLFVQENDGTRTAYDGENVPTQLVRRIITSGMGFADRWHWRDYPGQAELIATYQALKGQIKM